MIADEDQLGACRCHLIDDAGEVANRRHPGLVDYDHRARVDVAVFDEMAWISSVGQSGQARRIGSLGATVPPAFDLAGPGDRTRECGELLGARMERRGAEEHTERDLDHRAQHADEVVRSE